MFDFGRFLLLQAAELILHLLPNSMCCKAVLRLRQLHPQLPVRHPRQPPPPVLETTMFQLPELIRTMGLRQARGERLLRRPIQWLRDRLSVFARKMYRRSSSARITLVGENAQTTIVDAGARFTG